MRQLSFWLGHGLACFLPTYVFIEYNKMKKIIFIISLTIIFSFCVSTLLAQNITINKNAFLYKGFPTADIAEQYGISMISTSDSLEYSLPIDLGIGSLLVWYSMTEKNNKFAYAGVNSGDTTSKNISSWNLGNWNHAAVTWSRGNSLRSDSVFVNSSENTSYSSPYPTSNGYGFPIFSLWNITMPKSKSVSENMNLSEWICIDSLYNDGNGRNNYITQYNVLCSGLKRNEIGVGFPHDGLIKDDSFDSVGVSYYAISNLSASKEAHGDSIKTGCSALQLVGDGINSNGSAVDTLMSTFSNDSSFVINFWYNTLINDSCKVVVYDSTNLSNILDTGWLTVVDTSWDYWEGTFSKPNNSNKIAIKYILKNPDDRCWFDGIGVFPIELDSSGFETFISDTATGWNIYGNAAVDTGVTVNSGDYSWKITNSDNNNYIYKTITILNNTWYTVQSFFNSDGNIKMNLSDATTKTITNYSTNWNKIGYSFKSESTSLTVKIYATKTLTTFFVDDFQAIKLETYNSTESNATGSYSYPVNRPVIIEDDD